LHKRRTPCHALHRKRNLAPSSRKVCGEKRAPKKKGTPSIAERNLLFPGEKGGIETGRIEADQEKSERSVHRTYGGTVSSLFYIREERNRREPARSFPALTKKGTAVSGHNMFDTVR